MPKVPRLKVGDIVCCQWDDTVAIGRTTQPDEHLNPAVFDSYGIVSHLDSRRLVLRQEVETTPEKEYAHTRVVEPVVIPIGCITKVTILRPAGEVKL